MRGEKTALLSRFEEKGGGPEGSIANLYLGNFYNFSSVDEL